MMDTPCFFLYKAWKGRQNRMKRLKILFITKDFSKYMERSYYYLQLEIAKHAELAVWHEEGEIQEILRRIPFTPDFILINDRYHAKHCPDIQGIGDLQIPWGMIMHDLHGKKQQRRKFITQEPSPIIFTIYRRAFHNRYPEYRGKVRWLPHFVEPSIFYDYQNSRKNELLLMGSVHRKVYPLRYLMQATYANQNGFVHHKHPGYGDFSETSLVAENFAKEINRTKIFLTCDSIYNYPIRKYFEVPACNTLLMAPSNEELQDLGFFSQKNYISISEEDFQEKVKFYLHPNNDSVRKKIAQQGHDFIHRHHTTAVRAQQLLSMIREIV